MFSTLGPLVPALLVIGAAASFAWRDRSKFADPRLRKWAGWLVWIVAFGAALVAYDTAAPITPVAVEHLRAKDPPVHVDPPQRVSLVVKGELPHVEQGKGASGTYTVAVVDASGAVSKYEGRIEEHWETHRVAKRGSVQTLSVHNDARYTVPAGPIDLSVAHVDGSIAGAPLTLELVPAPPPAWLVDVLAVALTLVAAILDARDKTSTGFALDVGMVAAFGAFLLAMGMTPWSPVSQVVGTAVASAVFGVGGAWVLRKLVERWMPAV